MFVRTCMCESLCVCVCVNVCTRVHVRTHTRVCMRGCVGVHECALVGPVRPLCMCIAVRSAVEPLHV